MLDKAPKFRVPDFRELFQKWIYEHKQFEYRSAWAFWVSILSEHFKRAFRESIARNSIDHEQWALLEKLRAFWPKNAWSNTNYRCVNKIKWCAFVSSLISVILLKTLLLLLLHTYIYKFLNTGDPFWNSFFCAHQKFLLKTCSNS